MASAEPADRLPCLTSGCPNTIQPATAARTGGYCGPCARKRDSAAREAHIRANRRDLDRYAGVTDPVDLLRLMHTPPNPDPLVNLLPPPMTSEELYRTLTPHQAARLMTLAAELLPSNRYAADDIGRCLAAFTNFSLEPLLNAWLDHDHPYPALIFRGASAAIRDRLLKSLRDDSPLLHANHVLSALAWIGDDTVIRFLQGAENAAWARKLYIPPAGYARVAGWELLAGRRSELTLPTALALHLTKDGEPHANLVDHHASDDEPMTVHECKGESARPGPVCHTPCDGPLVQVMRPRADTCPWCGRNLVNLLEANLDQPLPNPLHTLGHRFEVLTCHVCTCFGPIHAALDPLAHAHWAPENARPAFLPESSEPWDPSPWSTAAIQLSPRLPTYAADSSLPTSLSQIGGHPAWVQDPTYPTCLKCRRTMTFLAQIDQAAFPAHEGTYYAFACGPCRTTATTYQQT